MPRHPYRTVPLAAVLACALVAVLAATWVAVGLLGSPEVRLDEPGGDREVAVVCAAVSASPAGGGVRSVRVDGELREGYDVDEVEDRLARGIQVATVADACQQARTRRVARSVVAVPVVVLGLLAALALARRRRGDLVG